MTDFASFNNGNSHFPLATGSTYSLLRDADPALFYALEFFSAILTTHIGARLVEAAAAAGAEQITAAVKETLPCNPEPWLQDTHIKFPLLSLYRKGTTYRYVGQRKISVQEFELSYVLPPMQASEAEQILPILHAVESVLDNRAELGMDPAYTPSSPAGTAGESVWSLTRAGVVRVEFTASQTGAYTPAADLYFPAVQMTFQMQERSDHDLTELDVFAGADVIQDLVAEDSTFPIIVETRLAPPAVLASLLPVTGTKGGGDSVVLTGTGFIVGRSYRVLFGDADAHSVLATSATTIACLTPQHAAYPTLLSDVYVIDQEGQVSNTLSGAFTFTSP